MITTRLTMVAALATGTSTDDGSLRPEIDEGIDVGRERIRLGSDVEDVMQRDVRVQRAHEEQGRRAGLEGPDAPRLHRTPEVVGDRNQPAFRRTVRRLRVERHKQRPLRPAVHVDGDVLRHDALREGDEVLGNAAQHLARIAVGRIDVHEVENELRRRRHPALHRSQKQLLFGGEVAQDGGRRHAQDAGDVGERGRVEALLSEDAPSCLKQFVPCDARRPSHL